MANSDQMTKDKHPNEDEKSHKPGGKVIRGSGRGGICRTTSSCNSEFLKSRIRQAFLRSSTLQLTKLTISNLDDVITDSRLHELFSRFGPLVFAKVQCSKLGKSMGYADVLFEKRLDAIKAMMHYNGVPLEGRKMNIQFSNQFKKPTLTVRSKIKFTGYQEKHKSKRYRRRKRVLKGNDDDKLATELEKCMKKQLVISERV
ncbi:polyadenylate-binding protein 1-like isoform X1 [Phymastichus coffea]|uniref:polyadenylate-binding protein 1-like isoform X1 n=1 Tax=Phymastichus coffea TaxID=108790 RepID=UPI00273C9931|nr:polyadenylate-binding protein 1-like isoform X1 [Phymastichus coffea]